MILTIFFIAIVFMLLTLIIGYATGSFSLAYLGMFTMLLLGLFLFSDGLQIENGMQEIPVGSHTFVATYENYTTVNDSIVNILANTMFFLPFAGILLTTFIALRR